MISYEPKQWWKILFDFQRSPIFRTLTVDIIGAGLWAAFVVWIETDVFKMAVPLGPAFLSILGIILGLLLVFRTNTAYDRWWEGRKQWGGLVNVSRTLAIRVREFSDDAAAHAHFRESIPGFVKALRDHLRPSQPGDPAAPAATEFAVAAHVPNAWAQSMERQAYTMMKAGELTEQQHWLIAQNLERMVDILGACERILKTPVPYSYSMFLKKFIFLYVVTLPIGFVATFGWWSVPVVTLVFYILVSVELIAEEIEDPFGVDENDLPLDGLCETIQGNAEEILGRA